MKSVTTLLVFGLLATVDTAIFFPRIRIPTFERSPSIPRNEISLPRNDISGFKSPTFDNDWIKTYRLPSFPREEIPSIRAPDPIEYPAFNNVEPKPVLPLGLKRQSDIDLDNVNNNNANKLMPDPIKSPNLYNDPLIAIEQIKALFSKAIKSSAADLFPKEEFPSELGHNNAMKQIEPKPDTLSGTQRLLENNNNNNIIYNNNNNNLNKQIPDPIKSSFISKDPLLIMERIKASLAQFAKKSGAELLTKEGLPSELAGNIGLEHKLGLPGRDTNIILDESDDKPAKSPKNQIEPDDQSAGANPQPRVNVQIVPGIGDNLAPSPAPFIVQSQSSNNGNGPDIECALGVAIVECYIDPCSGSSCPGVPGAVCRTNKCGECSALWFNGQVEVTSRCGTAPAIGG